MGEILPFQPKPKLAPGERPKRRTDGDRLKAMAALDREFEAYRKANEEYAALTGERNDKGLELARTLLAHAKEGEPKGVA